MVLELIERLAASGIAVIVISHNLIDVFSVADRVAILYLGRLVSSGPASDYDRQSAVEIMTTGGLSERENGATGAGAAV
jgi:ABC-type sugar transport system ATPase subunit